MWSSRAHPRYSRELRRLFINFFSVFRSYTEWSWKSCFFSLQRVYTRDAHSYLRTFWVAIINMELYKMIYSIIVYRILRRFDEPNARPTRQIHIFMLICVKQNCILIFPMTSQHSKNKKFGRFSYRSVNICKSTAVWRKQQAFPLTRASRHAGNCLIGQTSRQATTRRNLFSNARARSQVVVCWATSLERDFVFDYINNNKRKHTAAHKCSLLISTRNAHNISNYWHSVDILQFI